MKAGLNDRRKSALKRLEAQRVAFIEAHEDRKPYDSTRNGGKRIIHHQGRPYDKEVERLNKEIEHLKELIR